MAIEGDILERIHVAIVFKQMPVWKYRGFFMFYMINFGPVLKLWNFRKRYFTATNERQKKKKKKKLLWNSTSVDVKETVQFSFLF